jgi:hypothetical protein
MKMKQKSQTGQTGGAEAMKVAFKSKFRLKQNGCEGIGRRR